MYNILSVGIKNIEDNWPTYRCNPMIMPFAGTFGQDTMQNFTFCIQSMQTNYMQYLMQPINYNLDVIGNLGGVLTEAINAARGFIDNLRNFITDLIQNVFAVFLNILVEFQRMMVELKDMMGKMAGILASLLYTVEGSILTMESTWNGAPGQMVRSLQSMGKLKQCFHPDTKISLKNGNICMMKDIPLNSKLKNGSTVQSVMKLNNITKSGKYREKLYALLGEDGSEVYVTGSHLIFNPITSRFISVKEMRKLNPDQCKITTIGTSELACLITSDHLIPIGDWIFHDWEDGGNGSASKTIES